MVQVLLVCLGNICRSPTAEAVMRARARGTDFVIDSAGTGGWHRGNPPDARARAAGERRGYDFTGQAARQVSDADFARFDHILAMDTDNLAELARRCPAEHAHKLALFLSVLPDGPESVPDPYYGGPDGFEHVLDLVEAASDAWMDRLADSA